MISPLCNSFAIIKRYYSNLFTLESAGELSRGYSWIASHSPGKGKTTATSLFTFSRKLKIWSFHVNVLERTARRHTKIRVAMVREKSGKSRSGKSQGIAYQVREFLNSTWKSIKSQGILHLDSHLVLERDSLVVKLISFQKILQRCWFLLALLPKDLPRMVSENWSLVSEKSGKCQGNLLYSIGWQPWKCKTFIRSDCFLLNKAIVLGHSCCRCQLPISFTASK